jgi:hypothetical protein
MSIDNNTLLLVVIVIFALVAIAGFGFIRRRAKVKVQGPPMADLGLNAPDAHPSTAPAAKENDATNRLAGLTAEDKMGRGGGAERVKVELDITAKSAPGRPGPKAWPPMATGV